MKIISWNLNGLKSSLDDGLASFIDESDADIYAFQETKVGKEISIKTNKEYHMYWSFNKENGGKYGTLCMCKKPPMYIKYDMGNGDDFDSEGRVITLEYEEFFLVNFYFPNSQGVIKRKEYRYKWDMIVLDYLAKLQEEKDVIVCGDFNVSCINKDMHNESRFLNKEDQKFETIERENFKKIIKLGFVDTFRMKYPKERFKYTWWSNKNSKRKGNIGYRLDYFLVSEKLKNKVIESNMLSNVFGSDHCPIILKIDINDVENKKKPSPYLYKDILKLEKAGLDLDEFKNYDLTNVWKSIDIKEAKDTLKMKQKELALLATKKDLVNMKRVQDEIISSLNSKVLAVYFTINTAHKPGVDNETWDTFDKKMNAALSLSPIKYDSSPNILYILNCKNNKQRHIQIPTYHDRAMQCLYAFALDPIAEAWGEKKSFSYRKNRSSNDLDAYIKKGLSGDDAPTWLFKGDVTKCYEKIKHEWIYDNIPLNKNMLHEFLEAGFIFNGELFPSLDKGIGIGCTISPIIANMTLDGMSRYVYGKLYKKGQKIDWHNADMIRYADDILFMTKSKETALKIRTLVEEFLHERGLELSEEKSKIIDVNEGFEFAGREYYKDGCNLFSRPSKDRVDRFKAEITDLIRHYKGSQQTLIAMINRKIDGFASYHKVDEAMKTFVELDNYIRALLMDLCKEKYKTLTKNSLIKKFWILDGKNRYCYALPNNKEIRVKCLADTMLITHTPILLNKNPYIDFEYFEKRTDEREINNVVGDYRKIWNRQEGKCYYCGKPILRDEERTIVEYNPNGKSKVSKNAYIHKRCLENTIEFIDVDVEPSSIEDLNEIVDRVNSTKTKLDEKYLKLYDFFKKHEAKSFCLTFHQIEEYLGYELDERYKELNAWHKKNIGSMNHCWLDNDFEVKTVNFTTKRVSFVPIEDCKNMVYVNCDRYKNKRMPIEAAYEYNHFVEYLDDKYGLKK